MKCIRCKHDNEEGSSHCSYCGYKFIYEQDNIELPKIIEENNDKKTDNNKNKKTNKISNITMYIARLFICFISLIILNKVFLNIDFTEFSLFGNLSMIINISFILASCFTIIKYILDDNSNINEQVSDDKTKGKNNAITILDIIRYTLLFILLVCISYIGLSIIIYMIGILLKLDLKMGLYLVLFICTILPPITCILVLLALITIINIKKKRRERSNK